MNLLLWLTARRTKQSMRWTLCVLGAVYLVSRAIYYAAGVRFADSWIREDCMSIVPYDLMRTDLLSSVWHFHSQPPLFSFFCGIITNLSGGSETIVFHMCYLIVGVSMVFALFFLMLSLGIPFRFAGIMTAVFCLSPGSILYENIIHYTYLVASMLVLSVLSLQYYLKTARMRWGIATGTLWMAIVLTRSLFHLAWFALAVVIVIALVPKLWKRTLVVMLIPFMIAFGWYAKNYVSFGIFGSSSWMGMNIARTTMGVLTPEEKILLAREGAVSELVFLRPFPGFWQFSGAVELPHAETTGVPILDVRYSDTSFSNYNNLVYLSLSDQFLQDSLSIIRNYPGIYVTRSLKRSFSLFAAPANMWFGIWRQDRDYEQNFYALEPFIHLWNAVWYGDFSKDAANSGLFIILLYAITILYWLYRLVKNTVSGKAGDTNRIVVVFMLMTIVYITVIGNIFELGENMRFRYNSDPLLLTLFGLFISTLLRRLHIPVAHTTGESDTQKMSRKKRLSKKGPLRNYQ